RRRLERDFDRALDQGRLDRTEEVEPLADRARGGEEPVGERDVHGGLTPGERPPRGPPGRPPRAPRRTARAARASPRARARAGSSSPKVQPARAVAGASVPFASR